MCVRVFMPENLVACAHLVHNVYLCSRAHNTQRHRFTVVFHEIRCRFVASTSVFRRTVYQKRVVVVVRRRPLLPPPSEMCVCTRARSRVLHAPYTTHRNTHKHSVDANITHNVQAITRAHHCRRRRRRQLPLCVRSRSSFSPLCTNITEAGVKERK